MDDRPIFPGQFVTNTTCTPLIYLCQSPSETRDRMLCRCLSLELSVLETRLLWCYSFITCMQYPNTFVHIVRDKKKREIHDPFLYLPHKYHCSMAFRIRTPTLSPGRQDQCNSLVIVTLSPVCNDFLFCTRNIFFVLLLVALSCAK